MIKDEHDLLNALSEKQREALDLLILHKTSKQISRELGISPHTVDQRIEAAKRRLGVATRGEAAQRYRHLLDLCQQMTYDEFPVANRTIRLDQAGGSNSEQLLIQADPRLDGASDQDQTQKLHRVLPGAFKGHWGKLYRLAIIAAIAVLCVFTALGGILIFIMLSDLFAKK